MKLAAIASIRQAHLLADPNRIPDLLDFFITREVLPNFVAVEKNYDLDSDHATIILTLSEGVIRITRPTLVNKTIDWGSSKIDLQNVILPYIVI